MLSLEDRLLLLTAGAGQDAREPHRLRLQHLLAGPLDWRSATFKLWAHGLAPLFYHQLQQANLLGLVPSPALSLLERWTHATIFRNFRLKKELIALLKAAQQARIPVMLLQGAALNQTIQRSWTVRPMSDLDLLIPSGRLLDLELILEQLGYRLHLRYPSSPQTWRRYHMHVAYRREGGGGPVEIHWQRLPPYPHLPWRLNLDSLWRESQAISVDGATAQVMNAHDLLIDLCLHHWRHGCESLLGYADVAMVTRGGGGTLSWAVVREKAHQVGADSVVGYVLWWTRTLLGAPVPTDVTDELCPQAVTLDRWRRWLDRGSLPRAELVGNRWARIARATLLLGDSRCRTRFARESLLPSAPAFARFFPLGEGNQRYLYYLLHPARLLRALQALARLAF